MHCELSLTTKLINTSVTLDLPFRAECAVCGENTEDLLSSQISSLQHRIMSDSHHSVHYIPGHIHLIPQTLYFLNNVSVRPAQVPGNHHPLSAPMSLTLSDSICKWNHTILVFLCLGSDLLHLVCDLSKDMLLGKCHLSCSCSSVLWNPCWFGMKSNQHISATVSTCLTIFHGPEKWWHELLMTFILK